MAKRAGAFTRFWIPAALPAALFMMSHSASAACLRKTLATAGGTPASSFLMVPEREVAQYTSQGFARVDCPSDAESLRQYVKRICEAPLHKPDPAIGNDPTFEQVRARACASARAALAESGG